MLKKILSIPDQIVNFIKLTFEELKNVVWLSRKQTIKYTVIILVVLIVSALIILALDKGFLLIRNLII